MLRGDPFFQFLEGIPELQHPNSWARLRTSLGGRNHWRHRHVADLSEIFDGAAFLGLGDPNGIRTRVLPKRVHTCPCASSIRLNKGSTDMRMRRDGARIDQGVCITSYASQCRTVDQVVVLPDGADAKGWYVSLSRAREAMHVYTRDKTALRQSVMHPGERKSVWELVEALGRLKPQSRNPIMPALWMARHAEIVRETGMER